MFSMFAQHRASIIDPEAHRAWEFEGRNRLREIPAGGQITAGPIVPSLTDLFAGF